MDVEQKVALTLGQQIIRTIALADENDRLRVRVAELEEQAADKNNPVDKSVDVRAAGAREPTS